MSHTPLVRFAHAQARQVRGRLAFAALCTGVLSLIELARPWPVKIIFDYVLLKEPLPGFLTFLRPLLGRSTVLALFVLCAAVIAVSLLLSVFAYMQVYLTSSLGSEIVCNLRRELFVHLQRLSLSFYSRSRSGELLTRIATDTGIVKDVFVDSALTLATDVLTIFGVMGLMFTFDWRLALVVVATMPFPCWYLFRVFTRAQLSARQQRKKEERIATQIGEVVSSASLVKAFGREEYEERRFDTENEDYLVHSVQFARIEAFGARAVELSGAIGTAVVIFFASIEVLDGRLTPGSVVMFAAYVSALYRPMRNLAKLSTKLSRAAVSAQRIGEILAVEPEVSDPPGAIDLSTVDGSIAFDGVWFEYGDGRDVLRDVSFSVAAGRRVAIVGVSGTGKSTIASLLLRLYEPHRGVIRVDGRPIADYRRDSLRRSIAIVLQDSVLFGASIKENIAYGKLDATFEEIVAAATAAEAHEFILRLEHGYDTVVGERGATLSGGQRQRIAIARAMIRDASVLVLDEPTTGLDPGNQARVNRALATLMRGKTCVLITHNQAAAATAHFVVFLSAGRVVAQGPHQTLMATSAAYRDLWSTQEMPYVAAR